MTRPDLPAALVRHGWQWHSVIETALVRENKQGRDIKDSGDATATLAAVLRTIPKRGRPAKKRPT